MKQLTHGSLFAGIGGFDLGFERAGIKTVWQVEIDPFCRKVLERHWPNVQRFGDIQGCNSLPKVDVLTGGFPCQDISDAGKRAGIEGARSGLWKEYARLIGELRPRFAIVENVSALLDRGMGRVLGDLASLGYDAEWSIISACTMGAPHMRERVFIIAYPTGQRPFPGGVANGSNFGRWMGETPEWGTDWLQPKVDHGNVVVGAWGPEIHGRVEPVFLGVAHGIPELLDRRRSLGNAIVPQIAEWIGRRIVEVA